MATLSSNEIKDKILARESFWVGTESERVNASRIAKTLSIKYTTGSDERGGFYICHLAKVKKGK